MEIEELEDGTAVLKNPEALRAARRNKRLSQARLAELVPNGYQSAVSRAERGLAIPTDLLRGLCAALTDDPAEEDTPAPPPKEKPKMTTQRRSKKSDSAGLVALNKDVKEDGTLAIDDIVSASVLAMYFIQKLGKASVDQIGEKIAEKSGAIDRWLLKQACEALQKRGFVSYASGRTTEHGVVKMWAPRNVQWSLPKEAAHIKELLEALVENERARELIEAFNKDEKKGAGTKKATRKLGYDEYVEVVATFVTIDEMLGSQPSSPWLDSLVRKSKYNGVKADLRFWRSPSHEGHPIEIPSDVVKGWLRTAMRTQGYGDTTANYLGISSVILRPKKPLKQAALPVIDQRSGGGRGLPTYEVLQPGEVFDVRLSIPTRGFMSPEKLELFLASYAPRPLRGMSPARGARFGKLALIGFEVLGEARSAETSLASVIEDIPEEHRAYTEALLARVQADGDVSLRKGTK